MTELEILNAMLAAVGSNGVTSTTGRHPQLMKAQPILNRVDAEIQSKGHWFNTDWKLPLAKDSITGEFLVPQRTLSCDPSDPRVKYVRRGRRMYDPHNHTYDIDEETILVDVVIQLDIEDLPVSAVEYITTKAIHLMVLNSEITATEIQTRARDMQMAQIAFNEDRVTHEDTSLRDNPNYAYIMSGLPKIGGRSQNPKIIGGG